MKKYKAVAALSAVVILFCAGCSANNANPGQNARFYADEYGMTDDMSMITMRINSLDGITDSDVYVYDNYIAVRLKTDKDRLSDDFRDKVESIVKEHYPGIETVDIIY